MRSFTSATKKAFGSVIAITCQWLAWRDRDAMRPSVRNFYLALLLPPCSYTWRSEGADSAVGCWAARQNLTL